MGFTASLSQQVLSYQEVLVRIEQDLIATIRRLLPLVFTKMLVFLVMKIVFIQLLSLCKPLLILVLITPIRP